MGMLYRLISRFCVLLYYLRILSNFAHTGHYLKVIQTTLLILALKSYINETTAHNSTLRCVCESLVVHCCVVRAWRRKYWCMGMPKIPYCTCMVPADLHEMLGCGRRSFFCPWLYGCRCPCCWLCWKFVCPCRSARSMLWGPVFRAMVHRIGV